jgi:putative MATE family efflux protein
MSTKSNSFINDLTQGSVAKKLLYFAFPFMLSNLLQTVYNLVDMSVVGHYMGSAGLSAVSVGGRLVELLTMLCTGFCTGGQILLAQQVGAKKHEDMQKTIGTLFTFTMLLAVVLGLLSILFHRPLLTLLNTPESAFQQAASYMVICNSGCIFIFGYNALCAILRGMGDSKRPLVFVAIASVVNLILDLIFVAGFGMGAAGAAIATVISQAIAFLASLVYLILRRESFGFRFSARTLKMDGSTLKTLTKLGLPLAFQSAAISISMLFVNSFINAYGEAASAVYGVGLKLQNIPSIVTQGMSNANASMVGQNMAAGKPERVRKSVRTGFALNATVYGVFIVLCLLFPKQIFTIFTTDEAVLDMAPTYLYIACIGFVASIFNSSFHPVINGIGFTSLGMAIGLLDGVVARISFSLLFGITLGMGLNGFFLGHSLAIWVTALLSWFYYLSGHWEHYQLAVHKK